MDPNSVTIVTGGGRGIGRAIALRMAKETAVLVVGRTEADLEKIRKEIADAGGNAFAVAGDVTDPRTALRAERACRDLQVRNLVLNAGIGKSLLPH
jgi:meso-butanediol dehydrogenase/(S,S)-butanediol dehydrogenase/diacetyl reductase